MFEFRDCVSFDDVLLVPQKSNINSRREIDLSSRLGTKDFRFPIISSPMDTVTEVDMALRMLKSGGLGILHRYNTIREQVAMVHNIREALESENSTAVSSIATAIGTSKDFADRACNLFNAGARILCIDVAHGHHTLVESAIKKLRDVFGEAVTIIAGNVATTEGYTDLSDWGADAVRVGIGGGSICSTRLQTGHGVPTLQSVIDCGLADSNASIIADGGIKRSGDIVKALAAGADFVMLGSMLAGTSETPGEAFVTAEGQTRKVYRGMASVEAQQDWRGEARSLEGISTTVPCKGSITKVLSELEQNIKSGLSYSGALNLKQLRTKAKFVRQTPASQIESNTHILL
jgi:IMP dehydrogenase